MILKLLAIPALVLLAAFNVKPWFERLNDWWYDVGQPKE